MRRLESDTTLDNVFATGRIGNRWAMSAHRQLVLADLPSARHAYDARYSNVGTRLALHPDPRSSRIESGRGTRAEAFQSAALRRDAIAVRMGQF
jgi:hypothetical protein